MEGSAKSIKREDEFFYTVREVLTEQEGKYTKDKVKKLVVYTLDGKKVCEGIPFKSPEFGGTSPWYRICFRGVNHAINSKGVQKYILKCIKRFHKDEVVVANIYREAMNHIEKVSRDWYGLADELFHLSEILSSIIMNWDKERLQKSFEKRRKWVEGKVNEKNNFKGHHYERVVKEKRVKK